MADFNLLEPSLRLGDYIGRVRAAANVDPANNIQSYIRGNVDIQNAQDANRRANEMSPRDLEAKDLENIMARAKHDAIMEGTKSATLSGGLAKLMERERMDKQNNEMISKFTPMIQQMTKDKDIEGLKGVFGTLQGALKGDAGHPLHQLDLGSIAFSPGGSLIEYSKDKDGFLTHRHTTDLIGGKKTGERTEELSPEESFKYNSGIATRHFQDALGQNKVDVNNPASVRKFYSTFYAPKYGAHAGYFSQTPLGQKLLEPPEEDKTAKTTNPNEWAVYLAAAKGDPVSAVKLWQEHRLAMEGEKAGIAADKQDHADARQEKKLEAQRVEQEKRMNARLLEQELNALNKDMDYQIASPAEKKARRDEIVAGYSGTRKSEPPYIPTGAKPVAQPSGDQRPTIIDGKEVFPQPQDISKVQLGKYYFINGAVQKSVLDSKGTLGFIVQRKGFLGSPPVELDPRVLVGDKKKSKLAELAERQ